MAFEHGDLVLETTTTTGTGTLTLAGAAAGHLTFAAKVGEGNTCAYSIEASNGQKETGVGTVVGATLERTTLTASSTGSKLDLPAGTHYVGGTANSESFTPAAIGAATAAQGGFADSAVQPGDLGTAAALDVGTDALDVVQLDATGKLPAVDGSQLTNLPGGVSDHGALTGLTDDDHTNYALLAGRAGGQTLIGGSAASEVLSLKGTSHATAGRVQLDGYSASYSVATALAFNGSETGFSESGGEIRVISYGANPISILWGPGLILSSGTALSWGDSFYSAIGGANVLNMTTLRRDDNGILAQRNGTNAQTYRLYKTWTDASNYERLSIGWSGNVCTIAPEAAGTGTLRGLNIGAAASLIGLFGATPVVQPASAAQAVVTLGNADSEIGGLTISASYYRTEALALRDKCEELADDVRALSTLVHSLRTALVNLGAIKGTA